MRSFRGYLWLCAVSCAVATLVGGCGTVRAGTPRASAAQTQLPVFPTTMDSDGTVPWVDAPAVPPAPTPPPPAIGPTCTAEQLRGVLPTWVTGEQSNDGGMDPLAAASLHGWVNLTNVSATACTLDGVPSITLLSDGNPVNLSYGEFGANDSAKVGLPAHGTANFRVDWGAPYCPGGDRPSQGGPPNPEPTNSAGWPTAAGPFSLRVVIDGATLDVPVDSNIIPGGCGADGPGPEPTTSSFASSPIEPGKVTPGAPPTGESSPLRLLRASAQDYPSKIAPGQTLKYVIALTNPTGAPISLATSPPPAYSVEPFCLGNTTGPAINFEKSYSLNNRARPVIAAHSTVRFAMQIAIPDTRCGTTQLSVTWRFPVFIPQGTSAYFTLALTR